MDREIDITDEFREALDALDSERLLFITGRAGTGKSTLLRLYRDTTRQAVVVLAPTGLAALNVGGQTLHSFFRFPARSPGWLRIRRVGDAELYRKLDAIIIDEVSMVRADMMDAIDEFLRVNREKPSVPFGGVRMIFFGDLCQLPPVVSPGEQDYIAGSYGTPHFFAARSLRSVGMRTIALERVFRQTEPRFLDALGAIRDGSADARHLALLNSRVDPSFEPDPEDPVVLLTPTNRLADNENRRRLMILEGEATTFVASSGGKCVGMSEGNLPAPRELVLKVGAHVMFVRNDRDRRWVNGTLGTVMEIEEDAVRVELRNQAGGDVWVEPDTWEMNDYSHDGSDGRVEAHIVGTYTQLPLRLGYALTIHRSQGKTLDRVAVHMGRGAFESGQTYVALSRVRSLDGLTLLRELSQEDILVDDAVARFVTYGELPPPGRQRQLTLLGRDANAPDGEW